MSENPALAGAAGFAAVIDQWRDGVPPPGSLRESPFVRLSQALADPRASAMDRVALLRQALRYESLRLGQQASAPIDKGLEQVALAAGLEIVWRGSDKLEVSARAWRPVWLEDGRYAVDEVAMQAPPRRFGALNVPRPDPFLQSTGYTSVPK